jgi:hypothetical protein
MMTLLRKTDWLAFGLFPICLVFLLGIGAGCHRQSDAPPQALPADQLAPAMEKAFADTQPGLKERADKIIASLKTPDYPQAFTELRDLQSQPKLTQGEYKTLASVLITVNQQLQSERSKGDQRAAQALQQYMRTK